MMAQQLELNPDFKPALYNLNADNSRVDVTGEITWLIDETEASSFGGTGAFTFMPLMEFNVNDINYLPREYGKIKSVETVLFHLNSGYLNIIRSARIVILQGSSLNTATESFVQSIITTELSSGWNMIELSSSYEVDPTKNLYIGYELVTSRIGYPVSAAVGTNAKQGWYKWGTGGTVNNIVNQGNNYVFMIKAGATIDREGSEIKLESLNIPSYAVLDENLTVKGLMRNIGGETINSFTASYTIDGEQIVEEFTNIEINSGYTYEFSFSIQYQITELIDIDIEVKIFNPNGEMDNEIDNSLNKKINIVSELVQRVVFHEVFSSSTCDPCKPTNEALKQIFNESDPDKFSFIKYQMSWPGLGDPYFTAEGSTRRSYYNVSGVPDIYVNGNRTFIYSANHLISMMDVPAKAIMEGFATRNDKTINFDVVIESVAPKNDNLRLFVDIIEKETSNDAKTNDETIFYNVTKVFMTSASGNVLEAITVGEQKTVSLSYTFNGQYRLPLNSNNSINNAIEHSVENFDNLRVVYWIQNYSTKEVWQSGMVIPVESTDKYVNFSAISSGTMKATINDEEIEPGQLVEVGSQIVFTANPDTYYEVKEWKHNGMIITNDHPNEYIISSLESFANVTVEFQATHHIVNYSAVNDFGTITATVNDVEIDSEERVLRNSQVVFIAIPDEGYIVKQWKYNGKNVLDNDTNEYIIQTLTADADITVEFQKMTEIKNQELSKVKLYPNPFTNIIIVSNAESIRTVRITNVLGQTVKEIKPTNAVAIYIDTNDLAAGIYLVTLQAIKGDRVVHRIVKQK